MSKELIAAAAIMGGYTGFAILHDGRGGRIIRVHDGGNYTDIHETELDGDFVGPAIDAIQALHSGLMENIQEAASHDV